MNFTDITLSKRQLSLLRLAVSHAAVDNVGGVGQELVLLLSLLRSYAAEAMQ